MQQGIYRIRNMLDDMRYVGSTQDLEKGLVDRRERLRKNKHYNPRLQNAWNKYGEENFVFEVEEEVVGNNVALLAHEQVYLDEGFELGILYNVARKAGGGNLGPEVNQSIAKYYETHNHPNKGIPATEEAVNKNRETSLEYYKTHDGYWLGKKRAKETITKWRDGYTRYYEIHGNPMQGQHHTEEVKQHLSEQKKEWHKTHENPFKGEHHTEAAREQMSLNSGQARSYPAFYNARTDEHIPAGHNLRRMCRELELMYGCMLDLKNGKIEQTNDGWRAVK